MLAIDQLRTEAFSLLSYVIREPRTNEALIIDPPHNVTSRIDAEALKIRAVINTHLHPDHTQGNPRLSPFAPILAHVVENTRFLRFYNTVFTFLMSGQRQPRISFSLSEGTRISLGDETIEILHTPGHSPGSVCLSWDGNLVSGDTLFAEGVGRTDIPGGSSAQLKKSIARLMELPAETVIWPGHSYGGSCRATLAQVAPFLKRILSSR
ncbi:MAG: MBL fold metallo-hydrolase [Syntrophaceae bacterium]|nr:MBL fold metallo-hydrolase [Deltaproteobacteria bacterium]